MKIEDIEKLIRLLDASSLTRLEYETESESLKLSKKKEYPRAAKTIAGMPAAMPAAMPAQAVCADAPAENDSPRMDSSAQTQEDDSITQIRSTFVGTISLNDERTGKPLICVGSSVKKGQILCQVEAMKMYNDVISPVSGVVLSVDVENGAVVEFDTLIAKIRCDR